MIYDCFMFFNELDVLEVRLNELYNVVDKFILVEADKTFTNQNKPLYYEINKERFAKFADKIEHIIITEYPEFDAAWTFENYQRDVIIKTLKERCSDDDLIIISDLDEIPRASLIKKHKDTEGIKVFEQKLYTFYFNYLNATEPVWTRGTRLLKFKDVGNKTLTDIRMAEGKHIKDAGWHFTYLGGLDMVRYKIKSFAHQEYNNNYYMNDARLKRLIHDGVDIFERGYKYRIVNIDKSFPEYVCQNKAKFDHLIIKDFPFLHKLKNKLTKSKQQDKRYVDTVISVFDYPIQDFISPNSKKILYVEKGFKVSEINDLPDNHYDCVIFDGTLGQFEDPQDVLSKLKQKLNRNGYIVMTVANLRYIKLLDKLMFKKSFDINTDQLRFFTRKNLFDLITASGYYIITFKGLNPDNSLNYKLKNAMWFGNLYDCKHEKFLCVIKG